MGCEGLRLDVVASFVEAEITLPNNFGGLTRPKESVVLSPGWSVLSPLEIREGSGHVMRSNQFNGLLSH